jgi:hypothetical protein
MRGEAGRADALALVRRLHAVQGAVVAQHLRIGEAGFEIAEQRINFATLEPQVEFAARGGVIALPRSVAIHGVVAVRVDRAEQAAIGIVFAVAVVCDGREP